VTIVSLLGEPTYPDFDAIQLADALHGILATARARGLHLNPADVELDGHGDLTIDGMDAEQWIAATAFKEGSDR
jgi:hypothetical protein